MIHILPYWIVGTSALLFAVYLFMIRKFEKVPEDRSNLAEWLVREHSRKTLNSRVYPGYHNVTLETKDGGTTQIDHIFVSQYGIFVVETKSHTGVIHAHMGSSPWKIDKQEERPYIFSNPFRQNYKHVYVVAMLLGLPVHQVTSLVVFSFWCDFPLGRPKNACKLHEYGDFITSHQDVVFSSRQVAAFKRTLKAHRLPATAQTDEIHLAHVLGLQNRKDRSCYKCGEPMVRQPPGSEAPHLCVSPQCPPIADAGWHSTMNLQEGAIH